MGKAEQVEFEVKPSEAVQQHLPKSVPACPTFASHLSDISA